MPDSYNGVPVPHDGARVTYKDGRCQAPPNPIIPFIEGDGTGRDIWKASVRVFDAAVEKAYDKKRRGALLDTLERYLAERRSVVESARALFIHPNTLRQRLGRIEELTGLSLDEDDLLSLELAIKLARLHGRPAAVPGGRS